MRNVTGSVGKWLAKGRVIAFGMSGGNAAITDLQNFKLTARYRSLLAVIQRLQCGCGFVQRDTRIEPGTDIYQ